MLDPIEKNTRAATTKKARDYSLYDTPYNRFWARVAEPDANGCRLWLGSRGSKGYGVFCGGYGERVASRAAWVIANGAIPSGMFVCHHCDVPACVNVEHLFIGSAKDNSADMMAKGRGRKPMR